MEPPGGPDDVLDRAVSEALDKRRRRKLDDPLQMLMSGSVDNTEGVWNYGNSWVGPVMSSLHGKQRAALASPARHRFLLWGNQSGKTSFSAIDAALFALKRHPTHPPPPEPLRIWCSSLSWDLWENIQLPELLTWLPRDRVLDAPTPFTKSTKRLIRVRADDGTVTHIWGKSAEQGRDKYQASRIHYVWLDEEHPEGVWDELQPRLSRFGGISLTSVTPLKGFTWLYWRIYEPWKTGRSRDENLFVNHAGMADNPSISDVEVAELRESLKHDPVQMAARLDGTFAQPAGIALKMFDPGKHRQSWTDADLVRAVTDQDWEILVGIDFGWWRFAAVLIVVDRAGRLHLVEEMFSQCETADKRAADLVAMCKPYLGGKGRMRIVGDAANPQDINELNLALGRVLTDETSEISRRFRCTAVKAEAKARAASVDRLNSLFKRNAFLVRKELGENLSWRMGMKASSDGNLTLGSRWMYEANAWRYPDSGDEKAQIQDPDDNTADGADSIAATRYAVMTHLRKASYTKPDRRRRTKNRDLGLEHLARRFRDTWDRGM